MQPGDALRPFDLPSTIEEQLRADECVGHALVIVFYLKNGSEDDERLLAGFRDLQEQFLGVGINVVAVGIESIESHRNFSEQLGLKFPLLSDQQLSLARDFGVLKPTNLDGKPGLEMRRHTFFFDVSLRVVKRYDDPPVDGHAQEVLNDARA